MKNYACEHKVDLRLVTTKVADPWANNGKYRSKFSLWDIYPYADLITYPSLYEGFGNAFLEAIYFKKPMLINRYATFVRDIEPLGFDLAVMDGYLSGKTVQQVQEVLDFKERREKMVNRNYEIANRHYSYAVLREQLNPILENFFGERFESPEQIISPATNIAAFPSRSFRHSPIEASNPPLGKSL